MLIENKYELKHDGILMSLEGFVDVHFNFRSINFMDTFQGSSKSISLMDFTYELVKPGRLLPGTTEYSWVLFGLNKVHKTHTQTNNYNTDYSTGFRFQSMDIWIDQPSMKLITEFSYPYR